MECFWVDSSGFPHILPKYRVPGDSFEYDPFTRGLVAFYIVAPAFFCWLFQQWKMCSSSSDICIKIDKKRGSSRIGLAPIIMFHVMSSCSIFNDLNCLHFSSQSTKSLESLGSILDALDQLRSLGIGSFCMPMALVNGSAAIGKNNFGILEFSFAMIELDGFKWKCNQSMGCFTLVLLALSLRNRL